VKKALSRVRHYSISVALLLENQLRAASVIKEEEDEEPEEYLEGYSEPSTCKLQLLLIRCSTESCKNWRINYRQTYFMEYDM
jgi:hypothetical protein